MEDGELSTTLTFSDISYPAWLCSSIETNLLYPSPSPIQISTSKLIGSMREGKFPSLIAKAPSGTGKTLAFLSLVATLIDLEMSRSGHSEEDPGEEIKDVKEQENLSSESHSPLALILAPTREIAAKQINGYVNLLFRDFNTENGSVTGQALIGGIPVKESKRDLLIDRPKIVCGTLGRVLHMLDLGYLKLDRLKMLVLDEADQMWKQSVKGNDLEQAKTLFRNINRKCDGGKKVQILAFSATYCQESLKFIKEVFINGNDCVTIDTNDDTIRPSENVGHSNISEYYVDESEIAEYISDSSITDLYEQKCQFILKILHGIELEYNQAIVFYKNKIKGDDLVSTIRSAGFRDPSKPPVKCVFFHGDQKLKDRLQPLTDVKVILTTDVLARGIDLPRVNIVINFELCNESNQYMHRIGRTGRFGVNGVAISFVNLDKNSKTCSQKYIIDRIKQGLMTKLSPDSFKYQLQNKINEALAVNPLVNYTDLTTLYTQNGLIDADPENTSEVVDPATLQSLSSDTCIKRDLAILKAPLTENLKRGSKIEARKQALLKAEPVLPAWTDANTTSYDQTQFKYYEECEGENDTETLNEVAKMLGLGKDDL